MTDWREEAACRTMGNAKFYPPLGRTGEEQVSTQDAHKAAKEICATCPSLEECRSYVMRTELESHRHGVWGGWTPDERKALMAKKRHVVMLRRNEETGRWGAA